MSDPIRIVDDTFSSSVAWPESGLVGTIGFSLIRRGVTVIARTTSGVVEFPDGSGVYTISGLSSPANGTYQGVWDDGYRFDSQDIRFDLAEGHRRLELYDPALQGQIETVATELRGLATNPVLNTIEASSPVLELLEVT